MTLCYSLLVSLGYSNGEWVECKEFVTVCPSAIPTISIATATATSNYVILLKLLL
jgi:hypothetical protein